MVYRRSQTNTACSRELPTNSQRRSLHVANNNLPPPPHHLDIWSKKITCTPLCVSRKRGGACESAGTNTTCTYPLETAVCCASLRFSIFRPPLPRPSLPKPRTRESKPQPADEKIRKLRLLQKRLPGVFVVRQSEESSSTNARDENPRHYPSPVWRFCLERFEFARSSTLAASVQHERSKYPKPPQQRAGGGGHPGRAVRSPQGRQDRRHDHRRRPVCSKRYERNCRLHRDYMRSTHQ